MFLLAANTQTNPLPFLNNNTNSPKKSTMFSLTNVPSTSSVLSTYTSFAASAMLVRTVLNEVRTITNQLIPQKIQQTVLSKLEGLFGKSSDRLTIIIDKYSNGFSVNEIYQAAELYLSTRITPTVRQLKVFQGPSDKSLTVTISKGQKIMDTFQGIPLTWEIVSIENEKTSFENENGFPGTETSERRSIHLTFHKKCKDVVLNNYLPYVAERSKEIKEKNKVVKLYSLGGFSREVNGPWGYINLGHPSTFDTLAMDPVLKKKLKDDLDRFVNRREFYKRVGKVWKRGYLLYGPPGTGKSSLIAAMGNYLKFDIYDIEITSIRGNSGLKNLLVSTGNRSILVIEDIDCSIKLENRKCGPHNKIENRVRDQLTLSGLLNFVDGLWSSCGDERIIVFTTNYKERIEPALLRPGRMDMHIHMSYLTSSGFKTLAFNYLKINKHSLFDEIEQLLKDVEVTPAEVAEELMKSDDADTVLTRLVDFLQRKKEQSIKCNESKVEEEEEEEEETDEQENKRQKVKEENEKKNVANKNKKKPAKRGKHRF